MTDPIADMLTRIRNALAIKKIDIVLPYSKIKFEIAKILEKEKCIEKAKVINMALKKEKSKQAKFKQIKLILKYNKEGQPLIENLKRVSTPGRRVYVKKDKIPYVLSGFGWAILSTSLGLMTDKQARKKGVGGELICKIW